MRPGISLVPMTGEEYARFVERSIREYAAEKRVSEALSAEGADRLARESFERLLPKGLGTPEHFLFTIRRAADGAAVGALWFASVDVYGSRRAYLYDIRLEDAEQGKGYGEAAMRAFEAEARRLGLSRVQLHVFGHNDRARRLYEKLGFSVTGIVMRKDLA